MNRRAFCSAWLGVAAPAGDVTVILFLSTICPISNAYADRIQGLFARYAGKPVQFLLLNPNANETEEETRAYSRDVEFPVPLRKDVGNAVADRYNARLTPEAVLLDRAGKVRYQGAIDDARNPARVKVEALRQAIDAVLANQSVPNEGLRAFGCSIKRVRTKS
jgi:hypothetical protein